MKDASAYLEEARENLRIFRSELSDVDSLDDALLDRSDFLSFADYFFDGFVADFLVQSRIQETRRKIAQTSSAIRRILDNLKYGGGTTAPSGGFT